MSGRKVWKAPNTKLYNEVKFLLGDDANVREFPDGHLSFSRQLPKYHGVLRKHGIEIAKQHKGNRTVEITNSKFDSSDGSDGTVDSSNDQPSNVTQIQTDGLDSSSPTFHHDEVVKRLDSRTNNSKDVP